MSKRKAAPLAQLEPKRAADKPIVTIAIDFGTAGTGYAYSFTGSDVIEAKEPGGQDARKTLTNLLLNDDGSFRAFGFEARRQYSESGTGAFFSNYKMLLENVGGRATDTMAKAYNGKTHKLIDVIKQTLKFVKDEALKECGRALPDGLTARECQWVLTVPAIWSDAAKGFMRTAAFQAGLMDTEDSRRLLLALEPESAAIACDVAQLVKPGQAFMVLDTGGGTVDITINRLMSTSPLKFDEIAAPSGGPWGSTLIDYRFEMFVTALVGQRNFDAAKASSYWIELLENWEAVKISQTADDATRTINFSPLLEVLGEGTTLPNLVDTYNQIHGTSLKMRGRSTIIMEAQFVRELFKPNFDKIVHHVQELLDANHLDFIFLVGGFAESALLQAAVKDNFSRRCKVVIPVRPGLAVLRGAAQFGANQDVFASRVARFSYGFDVALPYDATNAKHVAKGFQDIMTPEGLVKYVYDKFRQLVKVGDKLLAGHVAESHKHWPPRADQTAISFSIFATPLGQIDWTTESSARKIGTVTVDCLHGETCTIQLQFGATEITATATNEVTGKAANATLRYE